MPEEIQKKVEKATLEILVGSCLAVGGAVLFNCGMDTELPYYSYAGQIAGGAVLLIGSVNIIRGIMNYRNLVSNLYGKIKK